MLPLLVILSSIAVGAAYVAGRSRNRAIGRFVLSELESTFEPEKAEYAVLGRGIGVGFDYHLSGPVALVTGVLTLLPRYAVLYLPIAYLLGRNDLVKLTFHSPDLPVGTGAIVHMTAPRSRWSAIERDPDWQWRTVALGERRYTLFSYNPYVDRRLESLLQNVADVVSLNQISLSSRDNRITVFLTPFRQTLREDLQTVRNAVFSLTASDSGFTVT